MAFYAPIDRHRATPLADERRIAVLLDGEQATIGVVTGGFAIVATAARPDLGRVVALRHPRGGTVRAVVAAHGETGLHLSLAADEPALAFALAVIAERLGAA